MTLENPYDPPAEETKPVISGRSPGVWAWIVVIVGSLVAGGFMFFVSCFGVLLLFGIGGNISGTGGNISGTLGPWDSILPFLMGSIPFLAFAATVFLMIRAFQKSTDRSRQREINDD